MVGDPEATDPEMPMTMANEERAMLIGAPNVSINPTNGARIGISR